MLFKQEHLEKIKSGSITLAFRKWKKPSVKTGSHIKTSVGIVQINGVSEITIDKITDKEAKLAGFDTSEALISLLNNKGEGNIYRIEVGFYSEDPRIELRQQSDLSEEDFQSIKASLERLDRYSKTGPWTVEILKAIQDNPKLKAMDFASKTGREKDWLKP